MTNELKEPARSDPDLLAWVYHLQALNTRVKRLEDRMPKKSFDPQFGPPEKYVFANVYVKQLRRLLTMAQDDLILLKASCLDGEDCGALTTGFAKRAQNLSGLCVDILGDVYQNRELLALIQVKYDPDAELANMVAKKVKESIELFSQVLEKSVDIVLSAAKEDVGHLVNLIEMFVLRVEKSLA
jgi:hypothetical protein